MRRALSNVICLIGPLAAVVVAAPIAFLLPLEAWKMGGDGFHASSLLLGVPVYLGLVAAPGYVKCAVTRGIAGDHAPMYRWWIRLSMALVIACSAVGLWAATLMFLFGPPSLLSLLCAVVLWWRFERGPRNPSIPNGTHAA